MAEQQILMSLIFSHTSQVFQLSHLRQMPQNKSVTKVAQIFERMWFLEIQYPPYGMKRFSKH